jgi:hypothetical protein
MTRTHGVAATYEFCTIGLNGAACDECKAAHADKNAGQRFRKRRRRIEAIRAQRTVRGMPNVALAGIWTASDTAPDTNDDDEYRNDVWSNLLPLLKRINDNPESLARWLTDDDGKDIEMMEELCTDYVNDDVENHNWLGWEKRDDGMALTLFHK